MLLIMLLACALTTKAQHEISGIVISKENGQTINSTLVWVKNTNQGLITGLEGYFDLTVNPGDTIEFTSAGYKTKEILVSSASLYKVEMERQETRKTESPVTMRSFSGYSRRSGKSN